MKRTRHSAEQIIRKLKTAEQLIAQGKSVADVCRYLEVAQPTYHRWRQQFGGMQAEEARWLTQLTPGQTLKPDIGTFLQESDSTCLASALKVPTLSSAPMEHLSD